MAVMEAAQHGVPAVGYTFGLRDSVINGKTGILVEREEDFVAATKQLLADALLRRTLGSNARDFAASFSWEKTGEQFAELLQGLVVDTPSTRR